MTHVETHNGKKLYFPPKKQLLKWVGNKQKFAFEIASHFPRFNTYYEPFLGSGALLATVSPERGVGADTFKPLVEIWEKLRNSPSGLIDWYADRVNLVTQENKKEIYNNILSAYNSQPNGADFLFLTRACYGGIVRFRKSDGYMSTPCGAHNLISIQAFSERVWMWYERIKECQFIEQDYKNTFQSSRKGDFIYCDPPYSHSQSILYGSQSFSFETLLKEIENAKNKGVRVALSIDGTKKSGKLLCDLPIPDGLFKNEIFIDCGISMLKRFQMGGKSLEEENVKDRLLLTY